MNRSSWRDFRRKPSREREGDQTPHFSDYDCCAQHPEQNARIDGMTDHGVRAAANELVPFLDGDPSAPVLPEEEAGGDGDGNADGRNDSAGPADERSVRRKAPRQ